MAMIIDAHTHFFSRPFFEALAGQSPQPGSLEDKLARLAEATGLDIPPEDTAAHTDRWIQELDAAAVSHAVTFASLPQEADAVADAVRHAAGRLTGYGLVNPAADGAVGFTRRLFEEHGFRGVLLFPAMHHVRPGDPAARAVLEVVAEHGGVAVVHCGILQVKLRDLLGLPRPYDLRYASPLGLVPAANAFPEAHFVIPHFGAGFFRECLMAGEQCENIYVDTSSSNSWMRTQPEPLDLASVFRRTLDVYGPQRILFGTDSSTFPRGWRQDLLQEQRAAMTAAGADTVARDAILGGNAQRVLGLSP
jgi:predicted TIM-barrel fold metal-dependent hydrolase